MKTASIFYFSGTGNTWWAAAELSRQLGDRGLATTAHSIEKLPAAIANDLVRTSTLVGFGYPIYGSDLPIPMKKFIEELEPATGKCAMVFCTQWLWSGDGARIGAAMLKEKRFAVKWGEHLHMPNNISVQLLPIAIHTDDHSKKTKYLAFSKRRLQRLSEHIVQEKPLTRGFNILSELSGLLQRAPYRRFLEGRRNDMAVNKTVCTSCGLCTRLCPADNLVFENGTIVTQGHCINCMRCYNFCPVSAFVYRGKSHRKRHGPPYRGPLPGFDPEVLTGPCKRY
ncbi:MAG: EFR1 family ferrodoxin [Selenomonadales bacterium]|nr:EFR1 family ferrodoxin [Selenomonadales bacterium]